MFNDPVAAAIYLSMIGVVVLIIVGVLIHSFRFVIWTGYMRVVFVGEDMRGTSRIIKAELSDSDFEIEIFGKMHKYGLERNRIYRTGRFRLPTAYYSVGNAVPIDMLRMGEESKILAVEFAEVARNTVTRDLLAAFESSFLNAQSIFIITIIAIIASVGALGVFMNSKFESVDELLLPLQPAPITVPATVTPNDLFGTPTPTNVFGG